MKKNKLLNLLYRKAESELTDKDLLTGKAYAEYASNVASGMTEQYGGKVKVKILADETKDAVSAYTNGESITVNAYCDAYKNTTTLTERHWCVLGRIVHEVGHLLWTNFSLAEKGKESIIRNHLLHPAPDANQDIIKDFLDKMPAAALTVAQLWFNIVNCVEDGFIERLLVLKFAGYGKYLRMNRKDREDAISTVSALRAEGSSTLDVLISFILWQAKYGHISELSEEDYEDEAVKLFFSIKFLIDDAVTERSSFFRMKKINALFVKVFEVFKDQAEQNQNQGGSGSSGDSDDSDSSDSSDQSSGNGSGNNSQDSSDGESGTEQETGDDGDDGDDGSNSSSAGGTGESGVSDGSSSQEESADGSDGGNSSNETSEQNTNSQPQSSNGGTGSGAPDPSAEMMKALQSALEQSDPESSDGTEHNTANIPLDDKSSSENIEEPESGEGGETEVPEESNSLENIKKQELESKVEEEIEEEIKSSLNGEPRHIKEGPHTSTACNVKRVEPKQGEKLYDKEHEELDVLARRMMKNLLKEIKDRQLGDALDGNYFGNRLDSHNLYRRDKKLYIRDILPEDIPDMEVSILVDCSGSMSCSVEGQTKLSVARKTAYTVWKFCQMLKVPVTVLGHDAPYDNHVSIYSVADGRSIDGQDGKRIFGLHTGGCNRDGYALRFALNMLRKSKASDRIMFVISDGLPYDGNYYGDIAKQDIQDAVAKAKKEGISVITAGIGESAEDIHNVWLEGVSPKRAATFLELERDLARLPKSFVKVIKTQLETSS